MTALRFLPHVQTFLERIECQCRKDFSQYNPGEACHLEQCQREAQLDDQKNYTVVQIHFFSLCTHTQSPFW